MQVIVVWVGTNNHENTAEEVAGGIEAIVRLINTQQPQAKVIVLVRPCSLGCASALLGVTGRCWEGSPLICPLLCASPRWLGFAGALVWPLQSWVDSFPVTVPLINVAEEVL